ncbi:hypothetical protein BY996DRAFT_7483168 [Phakopsora pachyrhizi]|nr:hypothetical protein BY996DRAFT_7483168 [Phakopsora pachyrhizi]
MSSTSLDLDGMVNPNSHLRITSSNFKLSQSDIRSTNQSELNNHQKHSTLSTPSPIRRNNINRPSHSINHWIALNQSDNNSTNTPLQPPPSKSHSTSASPTSSSPREGERRSFQGDHHRYRFMGYAQPSSNQTSPQSRLTSSNSPRRPSPGDRTHPSQKNNPLGPRDERRQSRGPLPIVLKQHLGPPSNAHYSPHYGSTTHRQPTSKRKPAPATSPNHQNLFSPDQPSRALTPESPSPSSRRRQVNDFSTSDSTSQGPAPVVKPRKSRSPSPSPLGSGFVKKLGSVIASPFKTSNSRAGSDASEIGPDARGASRSPGARRNSRNGALEDLVPTTKEHLPNMPTPGCGPCPEPLLIDSNLKSRMTPAEQIIHNHRMNEAVVVPEPNHQVLRVVNGCPTTSTTASVRPRPDVMSAFERPQEIHSQINADRPPSEISQRPSKASCFQMLCTQLQQIQDLERSLENQTAKLDQLKNWSTAKITTLDHALKSQDSLLQDLQERFYEFSGKPDVKSDYLIALQKDFVELHSRLSELELRSSLSVEGSKQLTSEEIRNVQSRSSNEGRESLIASPAPSTIPTSVCERFPSSSQISNPSDSSEATKDQSDSQKAQHGISSLIASTLQQLPAEMTTPRKPASWKASSPANLASKLAPPPGTSPRSHSGFRSAPTTPSSRSPRPRYTSALGIKASSPLNLRSSSANEDDVVSQNSNTETGKLPGSPLAPLNFTKKPQRGNTVTEPSTPVSRHIGAWEVLEKSKKQSIDPINFHSRKLSVLGDRNTNVQETITTKPLVIRGNKKPVGDLIRMFDNNK